MRRIALALLLFASLGPIPGGFRSPPTANQSQSILAEPVSIDQVSTTIGGLTLAEGWDLKSPNSGFGGISGLALTGPRRFLMVSDGGKRLGFALDRRGNITQSTIDDLPPLDQILTQKRFRDAEAITHDPATGNTWIALEGIAQIWRFDAADVRRARQRNRVISRWPANGGSESLARLPDRRFVAFSERPIRNGLHEALLFSGDPAVRRNPYIRFHYDDGGQGSVSDAAALPDGRVLILHRKLGLMPIFTTSIAIADLSAVTAGSTLTSRSIAVIRGTVLAENYEGIAIEEYAAGLSIWIVSDDNQNKWQRTRLLRFTIDPAVLRQTKKAAPSPARPS